MAAPPKKDSKEAKKRFLKYWRAQQKAFKRAKHVDDQVAIVRALGEREEFIAGEVLAKHLVGKSFAIEVKIAAAQQLSHPRHKRHMTQILAGLKESRGKDELRVELVHTLGEIGDEKAVEPLLKFLQKQDFVLVRQVLVALRKINAPSSVRPLVKFTLAVLPPKQIRGARAGTKNRFDWDRYDEVHRTLLETMEALVRVRHDTHEQWRGWYSENKDQFK